MDNHPSLFEELNRKVVDALVWLEEGKESNELRPDQVYVAYQALFMAVSGLTSNDVSHLLSVTGNSMPSVMSETVMAKDNKVLMLKLLNDGSTFIKSLPVTASSKTKTLKGSDFRSGQALFKGAVRKLSSKGYQRL